MLFRPTAHGLFSVLLACAACSSAASEAPPGPPGVSGREGSDPVSVAPDAVAHPAIHFIDGGGKDVSAIYYLDPVAVRIDGLVPGKRVKIAATMKPWTSSVSFVASADGTIDTSRDAPAEGSYSGVDIDGVFWSMSSKTFEFATSANVAFSVDAETAEGTVTKMLTRRTRVEGVRVVSPDDTKIVGSLFVPPGTGKRPAILAFGGSEGGRSGGEAYASELLPAGYVVLAVAYFADKGLPADLTDIPLEYFDNALAWLAKQPDVDATRMGVIGGSRGGELSLLLASRHPELKAAVADVPSAYRWGAVSGTGAAWTVGGQPLPYVHSAVSDVTTIPAPDGSDAYVFTPMFTAAITSSNPKDLEAARSPVETSGAAIAMYAGADDQLWPSCQLAQVAMDRLVASGHAASHPDELTCFEGAGHSIGVVGLPTTASAFAADPIGGGTLALGGTPAGAARAGRARLQKVRDFLARAFAK